MTIGVFNSALFTQSMVKPSFAGMITRLMPNGTAPLFGMTAMLDTETALQVEHGFFTKTMVFPSFTLTGAGQAIGDTVFTGLSTANLLPGMILRVDTTGENVIINAVNNSTQIPFNALLVRLQLLLSVLLSPCTWLAMHTKKLPSVLPLLPSTLFVSRT